jgi:hypothetical protein
MVRRWCADGVQMGGRSRVACRADGGHMVCKSWAHVAQMVRRWCADGAQMVRRWCADGAQELGEMAGRWCADGG